MTATLPFTRRRLAGMLALAGLLLAGPAAADGPEAGAAVAISGFAFAPATLEIRAGQAVTWTNRDETPHQVVSSGKRFRSPGLDTGDSFAFVFTEPGRYPYFCGLHPRMVGTVVVH